jgi:cytochrome o ubiquinol oxidase subunit IV
VLALAFGVLIVMLIIIGSLWIMSNLSQNMTPMQMGALAGLRAL